MDARTSESHPLRIDSLQRADLGAIGITFCPGKKQLDADSGPWLRDLDLDLDVIAKAGFSAVLSLLEDDEYRALQVPLADLRRGLEGRGIECHHLPIRDVSVPDRRFESRWLYVGARARRLLRAGKAVLVHCKGGLGRSGLVAARLLVELGLDADEAIRELRAIRPGVIETAAQEQHVRDRQVEIMTRIDLVREERIIGSLVAGAVGDALGAAVEFDSLDRIRERFGPEGIRDYARCHGGIGRITDDTQMTLFTAEGLLEVLAEKSEAQLTDVLKAIDSAYRRWRMTQEAGPAAARGRRGLLGRAELWAQRAPGNTCLSALQHKVAGTPERPINDSKGCGGLMRVAPIGLLGNRFESATITFDLARRSAALTHGHPSGQYPAAVFALLLQELVDGHDLEDALERALELLPENGKGEETRAMIEASAAFDRADSLIPEVLEELGRGFVAEEALGIALACARATDDIDLALRAAVNHGGDSDSTGLLVGQLLGAAQGIGALAPGWIEALELLDLLLETGRDLAVASRHRAAAEKSARLLEFQDFFENPPEDLAGGSADFIDYRDEVREFEQLLYRDGWIVDFDWPSFQEQAERLTRDESLLAGADTETLRRLLITHFRKERFCEGHLHDLIRSGALAAILRRLRELTGP
ncbi:MAG: ADP-ribosylglycohydrolase family protein [Planctomycetes bacterium]|nr:ADP-ribosylglycohydrolase family protein [Planctomycetota bacterium]